MSKICDVCGLPEELCVCEEIAREVQSLKVFTVRRRFGKLMTIIEGIDEHDIDIKELENFELNMDLFRKLKPFLKD